MKDRIVLGIIVLSALGVLALNLFNVMKPDKDDIAILVMDTWQTFPHKEENAVNAEAIVKIIEWNRWWYNDVQEVVETKIVPLLEWAREQDVVIVYSNLGEQGAGWDTTLNPLLEQDKYNEPIINGTGELDQYLKDKGIDKIYYCGFAINNCILGKPTGMKAMRETGYEVNLIQDASLSGEYQVLTHEEALEYMDKELDAGFTTVEKLEKKFGG